MSRRTNRAFVTAAVMLASFLAAIEVTVISTAMPRIAGDLGGIQLISWVFAVYLLATAVGTPIFGKLADLFGRKAVITAGMVLFLGGSLLCGLSTSMPELIGFRVVQGLGAGAVLPVALTVVGDIYELAERGRVQGLLSAIWGVASIVGPLAGGFLVDNLSWHWVFFLSLPFGTVAVVLLWLYLHEEFERRPHRIDVAGAVTFASGMTALLLVLLAAGRSFPWGSWQTAGLCAAAIGFLSVFAMVQMRAPEPIVPIKLFATQEIRISNLATLLLSAVLIGCNVYLPLWIQGVLGFKATGSGLTLIPMSIAWPVAAVICARLLTLTTPRVTAGVGASFVVIGALLLGTVTHSSAVWSYVPLMILIGFGFGLAFNTFILTVQTVVPWNLRGAATASNAFVRALGQTVGVAFFGTWLNARLAQGAAGAGGDGTAAFGPEAILRLVEPGGSAAMRTQSAEAARNVLEFGLHSVFVLFGVLAVAAAAVVVLLPHRKLETPAVVGEAAE